MQRIKVVAFLSGTILFTCFDWQRPKRTHVKSLIKQDPLKDTSHLQMS